MSVSCSLCKKILCSLDKKVNFCYVKQKGDCMSIKRIKGHSKYAITDFGKVISYVRLTPIIMKQKRSGGNSKSSRKGKYPSIKIDRKCYFIHTLVASHFIGPRPEGMVICHNDGDPDNNHVSNLRYDTQTNNNLDKVKHGTSKKITSTMLDEMFRLVAGGKTVNEVSAEFNVCRGWTYTARQRVKAGTYTLPYYAKSDYRETHLTNPCTAIALDT